MAYWLLKSEPDVFGYDDLVAARLCAVGRDPELSIATFISVPCAKDDSQ